MIYQLQIPDEAIDQGDLIDGCPVIRLTGFLPDRLQTANMKLDLHRVVVLTQTSDLANDKAENAVLASAFEAQYLVDQKVLKPADIKCPLRGGRIWGWYFLQADAAFGLGEMITDLRRLHTVPLHLQRELCRVGKRRARLQTPCREHLANHFGDTFSRIGLPRPYETP
jgi:hypothetical protein